MGWFGGKDWNVIAIIFERKDLYRVNGNRAKGSDAVKVRDGAKNHERTIFWAVFDQKRAFLEGEEGRGAKSVPSEVVARLKRELPLNNTVLMILGILEKGEMEKAAKPLAWTGYPKSEQLPPEE
jgi:predicted kinase